MKTRRKHGAVIAAQGLGRRTEGLAYCLHSGKDYHHHTLEQAVAWSEGPASLWTHQNKKLQDWGIK